MAKKKAKGRRQATRVVLGAESAIAPADQVRNELLAFWDAFSPLNLFQLGVAYTRGVKLGETGILPQAAEAFANKYNAIIVRTPGKGPLVSGAEAVGFLRKKMSEIVDIITKRALP